MDDIQATHTLTLNGGYSFPTASQKVWLILLYQLVVCVLSSICLSYSLYRELYSSRKRSWKRAADIIRPIGRRLQNLEKEKIIWKSYLEWIEDYCAVYYELLNYLNSTTADLEQTLQNVTRMMGDGQCEERRTSEVSWEGTNSEESLHTIANSKHVSNFYVACFTAFLFFNLQHPISSLIWRLKRRTSEGEMVSTNVE